MIGESSVELVRGDQGRTFVGVPLRGRSCNFPPVGRMGIRSGVHRAWIVSVGGSAASGAGEREQRVTCASALSERGVERRVGVGVFPPAFTVVVRVGASQFVTFAGDRRLLVGRMGLDVCWGRRRAQRSGVLRGHGSAFLGRVLLGVKGGRVLVSSRLSGRGGSKYFGSVVRGVCSVADGAVVVAKRFRPGELGCALSDELGSGCTVA